MVCLFKERRRKLIAYLSFAFIAIQLPLSGSFRSSPDYVVTRSSEKGYFVRKDNRIKKIEVRHTKDFSERWSVVIDDYSPTFSTIRLLEEGARSSK